MIAFVRGRVAAVGLTSAVLEVGGVGLELQCTPDTLAGLRIGSEATLPTSMVVREDSLTLFGFADEDEKQMFELRADRQRRRAQARPGDARRASPEALRRAVASDDVKTLTTVPGIGQKGAQRIILELRDRIGSPVGAPDLSPGGARLAAAAWQSQVQAGLVGPRLVGQGGRPRRRRGRRPRPSRCPRPTWPGCSGRPPHAEQGLRSDARVRARGRPSWPT